MDVNKQAWPQGKPMTRQPLTIVVDGYLVNIPAQGPGNMFHRWLAWLPPELRESAYKLMNGGCNCHETFYFVQGKGGKPSLRDGVK